MKSTKAHMKVLLLGMGLQGKAVAHDLQSRSWVDDVLVYDFAIETGQTFIRANGLDKVRIKKFDAAGDPKLATTIKQTGAGIVICMIPPLFQYKVARACLDAGVHFVSSSYTGEVAGLSAEARKRGVILLPEMGMDPGIDLVLCRLAVEALDQVKGLYSYGAGIPDPQCASDNAIHYKISWTFEGVLTAYLRDAVQLKNGTRIDIPGDRIFHPEYIHQVEVPGLGLLEAYPNGDAIKYITTFGLDETLRHMGRFALRWPGHCEFWRTMVGLGLLDDSVCQGASLPFSPREFLVRALTPKLAYKPKERDVVIIRIESWGKRGRQKKHVIYEVTDRRDLDTGLFAMNRTVGYTAAIGAQLIAEKKITSPGVLSPAKHVPPKAFLDALKTRGIHVARREQNEA